jgi:ribulose-phosphate 3-epimerase
MAPPMKAPPIVIAPSLLSCDFARLADEVRRAEASGADWHHVDVMDGHFVPNLTIGPPVVAAIRAVAAVPLDVHLMIDEPARYAREFARAGAHVLTFHWEVANDAAKAREIVRAFRAESVALVGVSVKPKTPVEVLAPILPEVDLVLVMSVEPGFGGQKFMPDVLAKVRTLRERGFEGHIEMDGGLNAETAPACARAGTNVFVAGSALYGPGDMGARVRAMRTAVERERGALAGARRP